MPGQPKRKPTRKENLEDIVSDLSTQVKVLSNSVLDAMRKVTDLENAVSANTEFKLFHVHTLVFQGNPGFINQGVRAAWLKERGLLPEQVAARKKAEEEAKKAATPPTPPEEPSLPEESKTGTEPVPPTSIPEEDKKPEDKE